MKSAALVLLLTLSLGAWAETKPVSKDSDEAMLAAAEQLVSEGGGTLKTVDATEAEEAGADKASADKASAENASVETSVTPENESKKESEIPVFTKSDKLSKSEGSLIWRLFASLALIALVGGALIFAGKRWTVQRNKGGEKARIEILHQFHLGPKKSLVLIRVAGEALLIGCTDHSINLIKSIALIDDELEQVLGTKDFNGFLEDEFAIEDVRTALGSRK